MSGERVNAYAEITKVLWRYGIDNPALAQEIVAQLTALHLLRGPSDIHTREFNEMLNKARRIVEP